MTNLQTLRQAAGLTRPQLAEKTGLSNPTIWGLETGGLRNPSKETMERIATALGCTPADIWPELASLRRVCAWCGLIIADGPEPASHGICPKCEKKELAKLEREGVK